MDTLLSFDAILFPADGRSPHLIELSASPVSQMDPYTGQLILVSVSPHPEVHMDNIADSKDRKAWQWQLVDSLDGMTKTFANPYIIFYPAIPRIGASFPVNRAIREIQGGSFNEEKAWRGNIVVAKYRSGGADPFLSMIDISMGDFSLLRNYFLSHGPLAQLQ